MRRSRRRIEAEILFSSLGTAARRSTLYVVSNFFPVDPRASAALFDQFQIFSVLQPLRDRLLDDRLGLETVFVAITIEEFFELFVDTMRDCNHRVNCTFPWMHLHTLA